MKENSLKKLIEFIGLDYKKEIIKLSLFLSVPILGSIIISFLLNEWIFTLFGVLFAVILTYLLISSYSSKKQKILKNRDEEFITIINYFQSFISNKNNVYQSFKKLIDYSSDFMKENIEKMIEEIDLDKSVKPFIDFSNKFNISIAKNIMLSIYQMVDEGEDDIHLRQFENLFSELNNTYNQNLKEEKTKSLSLPSVFPMAGAALIVLSISFSIVTIVEDLINVI